MTGWSHTASRRTRTATTITTTPSSSRNWPNSWIPGDMSVTFKMRKDAKFHDGTPVTAKDVKWSFDRAVTVGGAPTFQMKAGSMEKPEQFVVVDDRTFRIDFFRKDKLTMPDLGVPSPVGDQFRTGQKARHRQRSVGDGLAQEQRSRRRRLPRREMDAWPGADLSAVRRLEIGAAAEDPARDLAHRPVGRQSPGVDRARRRRHLVRPAAQGRGGDGQGQAVYRGQQPDRMRARLSRHERQDGAVRQAQGAPGGCLRDPLPEDHGRGDVRPRQADVGGPSEVTTTEWPQPSPYVTDLAKAKQLLAEAGPAQRVRDHAVVRSRLCRHPGADVRTGAGKPRQSRRQNHPQQGSGRQLARGVLQENISRSSPISLAPG